MTDRISARSALGAFLILFSCATFWACASSQTHPEDEKLYTDARTSGLQEATTADEEQILKKIAELQPGHTLTLEDSTVAVQSTYHAASGRECRIVSISTGTTPTVSSQRVICRMQDTWGFAPDVYPASAAPSAE